MCGQIVFIYFVFLWFPNSMYPIGLHLEFKNALTLKMHFLWYGNRYQTDVSNVCVHVWFLYRWAKVLYLNCLITGLPYSEHSGFLEMKSFVQFIRPDKILPTVNNGNVHSRRKMEVIFEAWKEEKVW